MNDSVSTLLERRKEEFVFISDGARPCAQICHQVCDFLRKDPDVAAVVSSSERPHPLTWDVGDSLPVDALICKYDVLQSLLATGFRPLVDYGELDCAFRHAGWRVQMAAQPFADPPPRQSVQGGRRQFARFLYDLAAEQILAQGPRILKRTLPYHIWLSWKRWVKQGDFRKEMGFQCQSLLSSLRGDRQRVLEGAWRRTELSFRFPSHRNDSGTAVVIFTANRPWYLRRALRSLWKHWPRLSPILFVSQDGTEPTTQALVRSLAPEVKLITYREPTRIPGDAFRKGFTPYYRIAQHFGHSLSTIFAATDVERVIVLEDDIEIGPDFFPFMERLAPEMERDDLFVLSAWNDHGQYASCPNTVHRTDCFPGQGWMITRAVWEGLEPIWPEAFWDEWMRKPEVRRGRHCLRPELNRVRNFGRSGTGSSEFFDKYIAPLRWQDEVVESEVVSELSQDRYESRLWTRIEKADLLNHPDELGHRDGVVVYRDNEEFRRLADHLGIIPKCHESGPRAAFKGVVILRVRDVQLFLVPPDAL